MPSLVTPRFSRFSFNLNQALSPKSPKPRSGDSIDISATRLPSASTTSASPSPVDANFVSRQGWSNSPDHHKAATTTKTEVTATTTEKPSSLPRKSLQPQLYAIEYHDVSSSPQTPWNATFNRNAASTQDETRYLAHCSILRYVRIALASLLIAGSAAVLGMQADTYRRYTSTLLPPDSTGWALSVWPHDLNLTPTVSLIIIGAVSTLLNLAYLVIAVVPTPINHRWYNTLFTSTALATFIPTLTVLIYTAAVTPQPLFSTFTRSAQTTTVKSLDIAGITGLSMDTDNTRPDTIHSFTCHIVHSVRAFQRDTTQLHLPSLSRDSIDSMTPAGFTRLCDMSNASASILVALVVIGFAGVAVAAMGHASDRWIQGRRDRRHPGSRKGSRSSKSSDGASAGEKIEQAA